MEEPVRTRKDKLVGRGKHDARLSSPANDGPYSWWVQACSQTFYRDDSLCVPSHTCDESWILTKPLAGKSWSRNQVFLITNRKDMQPLESKALSTARFYARTPNLSFELGCWRRMYDVLSFASRPRSLYSIHCATALESVQDRCCSIPDFHLK